MTSFLQHRRAAYAAVLSVLIATPLAAQETPAETTVIVDDGDPGAYLAARAAEIDSDFRAAAIWYERALLSDPTNIRLIEGAIFAHLNMGELERAAQLAGQLREAGGKSQLADLALLANDALREDYAAILTGFTEDKRDVGELVDRLSRAWAEMGIGSMTEAGQDFDRVVALRPFAAYGLFHKALALALAGDYEGADAILSGKANGALTLNARGMIARIQILSQLERDPEALALLNEAFGPGPNPVIDVMRAKLEAGETLDFNIVTSARDGIAESFFAVATQIADDGDPTSTLTYARIAATLKPDHTEAQLMTASLLERLGQPGLAVEAYARFPEGHPAYLSAGMGRASALLDAGQTDEAIEVLKSLGAAYPEVAEVTAALGDLYRRVERWQEALDAYDSTVAELGEPIFPHWVLYFSRAITKERLKRYDEADLDFRQALKLNPDQPQVLNYLGYSMLERRKDLDEAFALIQRAIQLEPDSGYIIDSLAWGHFMLGEYDKALEPMELASLKEPVDPVVTDHLGDVYWMNGRKREAEFQWRRALSFEPEEKEAARIRRKLEIGLDAVMAEEKAAGKGD